MTTHHLKDAVDLLLEACDLHGRLYKNHGQSSYRALLTTPDMLELALRLASALAAEDRATS